MCCFSVVPRAGFFARLFAPSTKRLHVSSTKIFARVDRPSRVQWLVYSMALATPGDVAMVLPLPVARVADDALTFVDLSGVPKLFEHLDDLYPKPLYAPQAMAPASRGGGGYVPRPKLVVHEVGQFEASYVPRLSDMDRLDERFRIPELVWRRRPEYARFGFAVFKLKKGKKKAIHPMAMRFETASPDAAFFPTVHVHDGDLHDTARFDHELYYQLAAGDPEVAPRGPGGDELRSDKASMAIESCVPIDKTRGVCVAGDPVYRFFLRGELANADVRVPLVTPQAPAAVA
jgi:hypothetical protein